MQTTPIEYPFSPPLPHSTGTSSGQPGPAQMPRCAGSARERILSGSSTSSLGPAPGSTEEMRRETAAALPFYRAQVPTPSETHEPPRRQRAVRAPRPVMAPAPEVRPRAPAPQLAPPAFVYHGEVRTSGPNIGLALATGAAMGAAWGLVSAYLGGWPKLLSMSVSAAISGVAAVALTVRDYAEINARTGRARPNWDAE